MSDWEGIFKKKGRVFFKPNKNINIFLKLLKKEKIRKVLDLGCGTGVHAVLLAKKGFNVYASDVSDEGLKQTRKWLKDSKLKAKLKKMDCYKRFPYPDNFFEAIISTAVIHHSYHDKVKYCISEIERVLKPSGLVFITVPARKNRQRAAKSKLAAPHVYIPLDGDEKGLPHFIYNKALLRKDFKNFKILDFFKDKGRHYCLLARLQ